MRLRNVAFGFQERPQSPQRRPRRGPRGAQDSPREVRRGPGPAQERPKSHPERPQRLTGAAQDGPGTSLEGPGGARERPRSGPRDPEAPRRAQKGSPDAKTFGFYDVFAPPSPKSDGLAEVFKRNVKANRGFRGVDAPNKRNLHGFSLRARIIVKPSRRPCRGSRAARYTDENTVRNHWSKGLSRQLRDRCALASVH